MSHDRGALAANGRGLSDNFNPWDSLVEAYAARGDRERAIASYEQSLQLNPDNQSGRMALERLKK